MQRRPRRRAGRASGQPDAERTCVYCYTIEAKGLHPIDHELAAIRAIGDKVALARYAGSHLRADVDPLNATNFYTDRLFGLFVSPDFDKPSVNTAYLLQGGLGMPDRDYYLGTDEHAKATQAKYRDHIEAVLKLAGISDQKNRAARIARPADRSIRWGSSPASMRQSAHRRASRRQTRIARRHWRAADSTCRGNDFHRRLHQRQ